jgi:uncharacterized peroxidase-related enzyme
MSYVKEIEEAQADARLREIYRQVEQKMGFVPHYFKALGTKPAVLEAQTALSDAILPDGALPLVVKEQIGVVVSGINSSSYCIAVHMELLRRFGIEKTLARKLAVDYEHAPADAKTQALFRFAEKLTRKPLDIEEPDIEALRRVGWDDEAIRETALTVAYFNFINRVSFGLGLVADF